MLDLEARTLVMSVHSIAIPPGYLCSGCPCAADWA